MLAFMPRVLHRSSGLGGWGKARTLAPMRTVELIRTLLFLPTWIGSAWALHRFAEWGWLGAIGTGLVIAAVVCLVATLIHDQLA